MPAFLRRFARICLACAVFLGVFAAGAPGAEAPPRAAAAKSAGGTYFEKAVRTAGLTTPGSPDRLPAYLQLFERELVNDSRLFPCQVSAEMSPDGRLAISGFVGFHENRTAVQQLFECFGFERIDNRVEVLPSAELGDRRYGLIRAEHSFSYDRPDGSREVVTDCLLGTPVYLLKEAAGGYFLCHGLEGYVGYVDGRDIERLDAAGLAAYQSGPQVRLLQDHKNDNGLRLPMGARLRLLERHDDRVLAALPDGGTVSIPAESCRVVGGTPNPHIQRVIAAAERLLGTEYVWGGNTSRGIDCSGLVQNSFAAEGITLPRDSNQQALAGRLVATRWHRAGLRRGDTLYFLSQYGKIRHTAIYVGNGRFIEAVRPVVRYSSFDPASVEYSPRADESFCFAKRILD